MRDNRMAHVSTHHGFCRWMSWVSNIHRISWFSSLLCMKLVLWHQTTHLASLCLLLYLKDDIACHLPFPRGHKLTAEKLLWDHPWKVQWKRKQGPLFIFIIHFKIEYLEKIDFPATRKEVSSMPQHIMYWVLSNRRLYFPFIALI